MIREDREYRCIEPQPALTFLCRSEKRSELIDILKSKPEYEFVMARLDAAARRSAGLSPPKTPRTCGLISKRTFEAEVRAWRRSIQVWKEHFLAQPANTEVESTD